MVHSVNTYQSLEMRLTSMSDAFIVQKDDPKMKDVSFEDLFGMLVDIEYSNRKSNGIKRLITNAGFDQTDAAVVDINYTSGQETKQGAYKQACDLRIHHGTQEHVHYRCDGKRKDIYGVCLRPGSLQTTLQDQICPSTRSPP